MHILRQETRKSNTRSPFGHVNKKSCACLPFTKGVHKIENFGGHYNFAALAAFGFARSKADRPGLQVYLANAKAEQLRLTKPEVVRDCHECAEPRIRAIRLKRVVL